MATAVAVLACAVFLVVFLVRFLMAIHLELFRARNAVVARDDELEWHTYIENSTTGVAHGLPNTPATIDSKASGAARLNATAFMVVIAASWMLFSPVARAQETVYNVPSGDILDRGKVYGELDITYAPRSATRSFTPRIVVGIGQRIEVGLNVNGLSAPGDPQTTVTSTIKWKAYDGGTNGWAFLLGGDLFIPVQNRTYDAGNYSYAQFTKTWRTKTRATFGGYVITQNVVDRANRGGGQFAIEQTITKRLTVAADWFTGATAIGYVTPGLIAKITSKLTFYGTYQIGNRGTSKGNHQTLIELGYNFN